MENDGYKRNCEATCTTYGADEYAERVVLYDLNGTYFYGGFTLLRFGDSWKLISLSSPMGSESAYGTPQKITMADYEALL